MRVRRHLPSALAIARSVAVAVALLGAAAPARAEAPAVARARYAGRDAITSGAASGTVFFLKTPSGPVAVGASHNFDRAKLAAVPEVVFELGRSRKRAAGAARVLVEPGLAFSAPGGSLRTDLVVFALDAPPSEVRVLEAGGPARVGDRVRLLGIPASLPHDEDDVFGTVRAVDADRIDLELDVLADLRGWGGAPVLAKDGGRVVGVVQAAAPKDRTLRITASPIEAVTSALDAPLEGGRGRAFAALAATPAPAQAAAADAKPSSKPSAKAERAAEPPAAKTVAAAGPAAAPKPIERGGVELRPASVEIEQPTEGAVFGDPMGAFLSGRAMAPLGDVQMLDVVFVIDTSGSTAAPSGMDVNGNGTVGTAQLGKVVGGLLGLGSTDPGDTVLAAEVAAARQFLGRLDARRTRVALVTFAGEDLGNGTFERIAPNAAVTEVGLTNRYADVEKALARVLQRGPYGLTHMAAGVDQATIELAGLRGAFSRADPSSEKIVVFLTDGQPVLPRADAVDAVLRAAQRAAKAKIRFYTFGIGEEALAGPLAITQLADATGGTFTPVREASRLPELIAQVDFADIAELTVRNVTAGEPADVLEIGADGSFGAMVPLEPGKNVIEVVAKTTDGRTATDSVTIQYAPGAKSPSVPPDLIASRNRLLELRLAQIKRKRLDIEVQQAEEARKELRVEIEEERAAAAERAARQRKDLELEVERQKEAAQPAP
ncbi:MAG: hypothetical protein DCC71_11670 [Proteobacteria bacterium]|nr:MAG: hypothetical protein DCC71_11670 [Pseudomonadota bacterium]